MSTIEPEAWKHETVWQWPGEWGRGIMVERRGRDKSKNMYEWHMDMDNSVGLTVGAGGGLGGGGQRGKIGTPLTEQ